MDILDFDFSDVSEDEDAPAEELNEDFYDYEEIFSKTERKFIMTDNSRRIKKNSKANIFKEKPGVKPKGVVTSILDSFLKLMPQECL